MTVTEQLSSLGSWSLNLASDTPRNVTDALGFFGHIAIWRGRVDIPTADDATLLSSARYVGVLREKPTGPTSLEGSGMIYWLGDEDGKGRGYLESPLVFNGDSLTTALGKILPPTVTLGTVHDPGGTYTGKHQWQTRRAVLDTVTTAFGVEYRVNGDGSVDVGTQAQLYGTTAKTIISARGVGQDFDLTSLGGEFTTDTSVIDYSTRVIVLGQKTDSSGTSTSFVEGTADAASFPYKDLFGNPVEITRAVSDSGQTDASADASAQLQLNLYNRAKRALNIRAEDYDTTGQAVVGQNAYVFDPANGLYDPATQIDFRGELIFPALIRISALQWSVTDGHTVAFRTQDGVWIDLTRWVVWDPGSDEITVGDLPRTLTSSSNPVLDQTQAAPDSTVPNPPTGLTLTTTSYQSSTGQATAKITASWTAPTQNVDGSVITDFGYYVVQYRPHFRAPSWATLYSATTTYDIDALAVGLLYDVQVATVDTSGHMSAFTAVQSITAAPDTTAPNAPSDPAVTSYLGQLRIAWDGKDNTGAAMPADFAIVEVHVSATSGFTPDSSPGSATLVAQLSTAGVAYATAPYGATRYVKLVAVDNSFNRSAPSGQVSGSTAQVADGDVAALSVGKLTAGTMSADVTVSGRFATALTGARVEMNSLGFQKFDTDGVTKLVSITGTEALLTGIIKTALSGRRIEMGAAGYIGSVNFFAPDGTMSQVQGYTSTSGAEGVSMGVQYSGANYLWDRLVIDNHELSALYARQFIVNIGGNTTSGSDRLFAVNFASNRGTLGGAAPSTIPILQVAPLVTATFDQNGQVTWAVHGVGSGTGNAVNNSSAWFPDGTKTVQELSFNQNYNGDGNYSPSIQFVTNTNVGARLRIHQSNVFEFVGPQDSLWMPVNASAFNVNSDSTSKLNIRPPDIDPLDVIRGLEIVQFRRKGEAPPKKRAKTASEREVAELLGRPLDPPMPPPAPDYDEIGVRAERAHRLIRRGDGVNNFVDLGTTLFTAIAALQKVIDRVEALEGKAA